MINSSERILAPDLARGLMLGLIAVANIMIYLTGRPYGYRGHVIESDAVDRIASTLVVTFVDGRGFPLFAFLFGYGLVQFAARRGDESGRLARRRSLILIAIGAGHAILLFPGDILGWYGVVGLIIVVLRRVGNTGLMIIAAAWLLPAATVAGLIYGSTDVSDGRAFLWSFELGHEPSSYLLRAGEWLMTPMALLPVLSAALTGVVAARLRILEEPDRHRLLLRRVAVAGIALAVAGGLPSGLAVAGWIALDQPAGYVLATVHALTGVAGGLGYAAAFGLLALAVHRLRNRASRVVVGAITAAGRRSLSLYLGQSVLFVLLVSHRGLGLADHLGTAAAVGLALGVWLAGVVAADRLARAGRAGPAEWAVRRLLYRDAAPRAGAGVSH
ncbi:DUF418 domain-containing protein [Microlunatus parietis]|uniref:Putative membrane protein YeiB n=1 Tax=Microlunatus parietis TaxID=682979 RepID=A0A7Y9LB31_9ACTN|nr:DUF418 domain-containing protein [Microlunatus parietis]NYE70408.1 putative membrane protein YeiB [Microlunatus parietis]